MKKINKNVYSKVRVRLYSKDGVPTCIEFDFKNKEPMTRQEEILQKTFLAGLHGLCDSIRKAREVFRKEGGGARVHE